MKPAPAACPRLFEVQALRDGRLAGAELRRFQAHLGRCASCARESQALSALADALRSLPGPRTDDLHVRRERTRLLAAFDATLAPAPRPRSRLKGWLLPALVAAAAALTGLALLDWRSRAEPAALQASPSAIEIRADNDAAWSRRVDPHLETITLSRGTLFVHVDHSLAPRRLLILLPDATLEDLGTTFSVTASPAQTTHVAVQEGAVVLRLRGATPIIVSAGESWSAASATPTGDPAPSMLALPSSSALPSSASVSSALPSSASMSSALPSSASMSSAPSSSAPSALAPTPTRAAAPPTPQATAQATAQAAQPARPVDASDDASSAFRAALSTLNAGNPAEAAARFAAFLARYPRDHRAEDAAYLHVIALQRAGDSASASRAAREYIARYPNGFRRPEVESIAH